MTTTRREQVEPVRVDRVAGAALVLVTLYGGVRVYWQLGTKPTGLSPVGTDLITFTGWWAVGLCAVAALLAAALLTVRVRGAARLMLLAAAWVASAALISSGAILLLDVIGMILPGLGLRFYPLGTLSRAACVGSGVLLGLAALAYRRRTGAGCPACGRTAATGLLDHTPGWAWWAAYLSVAGCLLRIAAQAVVGFAVNPLEGGISMILFEVGFVLGGTVLPLALVHGWGRVWPRWVPGLAGRRVPRWLVLGPAVGISGGLVAYFGTGLVQMLAEQLSGRPPAPSALPEAFFWIAVPAYALWGAGMAVAALAYARRTRRPCGSCGR